MERKKARTGLALLCALGVLVLVCRVLPLGHELIGDEAFSARVAALPAAELLTYVGAWDVHPPLYYLLLGAMPGHDASEVHLRLLSWIAGLLQLAVLWAIGRRMGGARLGWILVAFAGITLLFCRHGAYARNYALLQLLATTAWLVLLQALEKGGVWRWAVIAALFALSFLTFYYAAHAIVALTAFFLLARPTRRRIGAYALTLLGAAAFLAPWVPSFLDQLERVRALTAAGVATSDWSVGWVADRLLRRHLISNTPWGSVWAAIALGCALLPLAVHRRWFRAQPPDEGAATARRWLVPTLGACAAYLLVVVASVLAGSFIRPRYAGFLGTLLCVAVALALSRLPRRVCVVLVVAITVGGAGHTIARTLRAKEFGVAAATNQILARGSEKDAVLCANYDGKLLYDWHTRGRGPTAYGVYVALPLDAPSWKSPGLVLEFPESIRRALDGPTGIWVLWMMPELSGPGAEQRLREQLTAYGWRSAEVRSWPRGVRLERFVR